MDTPTVANLMKPVTVHGHDGQWQVIFVAPWGVSLVPFGTYDGNYPQGGLPGRINVQAKDVVWPEAA